MTDLPQDFERDASEPSRFSPASKNPTESRIFVSTTTLPEVESPSTLHCSARKDTLRSPILDDNDDARAVELVFAHVIVPLRRQQEAAPISLLEHICREIEQIKVVDAVLQCGGCVVSPTHPEDAKSALTLTISRGHFRYLLRLMRQGQEGQALRWMERGINEAMKANFLRNARSDEEVDRKELASLEGLNADAMIRHLDRMMEHDQVDACTANQNLPSGSKVPWQVKGSPWPGLIPNEIASAGHSADRHASNVHRLTPRVHLRRIK